MLSNFVVKTVLKITNADGIFRQLHVTAAKNYLNLQRSGEF